MQADHISIEQARELWSYDPQTGILTWRVKYGRNQIGDKAGKPGTEGYLHINYKGRQYAAHRVALAILHGRWPTSQVDHKNRITSDNRAENIRYATPQQNAQNFGVRDTNPRPVAGVRYENRVKGGMWVARITSKGREIQLGSFYSYWEAVAARVRAERKYHPRKWRETDAVKLTQPLET